MPGVLGGFLGGSAFSYGRGTPVDHDLLETPEPEKVFRCLGVEGEGFTYFNIRPRSKVRIVLWHWTY